MYIIAHDRDGLIDFFNGLIRTDSINGEKVSVLYIAKSGVNEEAIDIPLPAGCRFCLINFDASWNGRKMTKEQAKKIWDFYDAATTDGHMLVVGSDEGKSKATSVVEGLYRACLIINGAYQNEAFLLSDVVQLLCDVRRLIRNGIWPSGERWTENELTEAHIRALLADRNNVRWRVFLSKPGQDFSRGEGDFEYLIRTHSADLVDISHSATRHGNKCAVSAFGRSVHALLVPQFP